MLHIFPHSKSSRVEIRFASKFAGQINTTLHTQFDVHFIRRASIMHNSRMLSVCLSLLRVDYVFLLVFIFTELLYYFFCLLPCLQLNSFPDSLFLQRKKKSLHWIRTEMNTFAYLVYIFFFPFDFTSRFFFSLHFAARTPAK